MPACVSAAARWRTASSATPSSTGLSRTLATPVSSSSCRAWKAPSSTPFLLRVRSRKLQSRSQPRQRSSPPLPPCSKTGSITSRRPPLWRPSCLHSHVFLGMRLSRLLATLPVCAVFIMISAASAAEEPHFPSSEDLRHVKALGGPQLSPDGKFVLFSVTDATADGAKAHIWVVSSSGGTDTLRQLTFSPPSDKRGEHNPQWAPDGGAILFVAKRGEQTQLFRLDMRGGEAAPYDLKVQAVVDESKEKNAIPPPGAEKKDADKKPDEKASKPDEKPSDKDKKPDEPLAIDVSGYSLSADGKWLAVWAKDPQTPGEKKQKDAKADAAWVNHDPHGTRVYLAALKPDGSLDGTLKPTGVEPNVHVAYWSPAAARLLVITEKS